MEAAPGEDTVVEGIEVRGFTVGNQAGERAPFYLLPGLDVEISASDIRTGIRNRIGGQLSDTSEGTQGPRGLLPEPVAEYVRMRCLYR